MYKRILALTLALVLLLPGATVHGVAEPPFGVANPTFEVVTVSAQAGEAVDVVIRARNNPGVASIKLKVEYGTALTLQEITYNSAIGGMSMQPQTLTSPVTVNWFNGVANATDDWDFVTLTFAVAEDAAPGSYPVTVSYKPDDVYDIAEKNVYFDVVDGAVTVEAAGTGLKGDVDENGKVNILDVMAVINIITGSLIATASQMSAAEMTGDSTVNILDAMALINYITGS